MSQKPPGTMKKYVSEVSAEQSENFIEQGDITVDVGGNGNSPNLLNGIKVAKAKGGYHYRLF